MTPEQQDLARVRKETQKRLSDLGGGLTVARSRPMRVQVQQAPVRKSRELRVTQRDVDEGRAAAGDIGKFWFVVGYSLVGGPDVVPLS
jgi:hypothetical protein